MKMRTETAIPTRLKDYQPPAYLISSVALDFNLEAGSTRVHSTLEMCANPAAQEPGAALELDGEDIELISLVLDGEMLGSDAYEQTDTGLVIHRVPDKTFRLEIETRCNPDGNTALSGLYRSNAIFCTQCEAEGFRRITYFADRPDVLSRYRVRIEADKATVPVLLSNGNLVEAGDCAAPGRHYAIWQDPFAKPCYLFALVAGDLARVSDTFTTASGRQVALHIYVEHGNEDSCGWAMTSLKRAMTWDEDTFGLEYDLDVFMIVAVSDFNMGAMENKGLNIFNDKYILATPETATDADHANIEAIIAHEYFHNWTGNRVTCRDWFQLCLKEGLTVFRDQEFSSDVRSRPVSRIDDVSVLRTHQFPEDSGPLAHPVRPASYIEINNFYTPTIYEKGAELVRMIQTLIGVADFRKGIALYLTRHDGEAATMEQFVAAMSEASGRNLDQFFAWYEQAGTPRVVAQGHYDKTHRTFSLTASQTQPATPGQAVKKPLLVPLAAGLVNPGGHDMALSGEDGRSLGPVLELSEAEQTFVFYNVAEQPVLSLNRGFSAPVKLTVNHSHDDLLFLMARDSDPFNRWEAGQVAGRTIVLDVLGELAGGGSGAGQDARIGAYCDSLRASLDERALEPAFVAQMLQLPGESDLAGEIGTGVDPDLVHRARNQVRGHMGRNLDDALTGTLQRMAGSGPYTPDAAAAGRRALYRAALALITAGDRARGAQIALELFNGAACMDHEIGALGVLVHDGCPEHAGALETFIERHRDNHLLAGKWLGLHAQVPLSGTVHKVRELMGHETFQMSRPNQVYALIGSFAKLNAVCFNAADGSGYALLKDVVLALDKFNPLVAARMAGSFKSWRVLEKGRRGLAEKALAEIQKTDGLSRDTLEIVTRTIGG